MTNSDCIRRSALESLLLGKDRIHLRGAEGVLFATLECLEPTENVGINQLPTAAANTADSCSWSSDQLSTFDVGVNSGRR